MEIKTLLKGEIQDEMSELNKLAIGSGEYKATVEGVTKLIDRTIELEKIEVDREEKGYDRRINAEIQDKRLKIERRDKIVGHILTGVSLFTGVTLTVWGTLKSLKFEETGTVTTCAGKNFIGKLFKK